MKRFLLMVFAMALIFSFKNQTFSQERRGGPPPNPQIRNQGPHFSQHNWEQRPAPPPPPKREYRPAPPPRYYNYGSGYNSYYGGDYYRPRYYGGNYYGEPRLHLNIGGGRPSGSFSAGGFSISF